MRRFLECMRLSSVVSAAGLLFLAIGCQHKTSFFTNQVRGGASKVDLRLASKFDWDRLFIFGPYSFPEGMCKDIGLTSPECLAAHLENVDEGEYLILFMKDRAVASREYFMRVTGNFETNCL